MIGGFLVALVICLLRFMETINPVVCVFFAVFAGALVVVIKNVVMIFKYAEHQRQGVEKNLMIFGAITLLSLILTCILAGVLR